MEECETPEEALIREIQEELNWRPTQYEFLGTYYDPMPNEKFIYFTRVEPNFEEKVVIQESQGGKFFTVEEIGNAEMIIPEDKKAILDLNEMLGKMVSE